MVYVRMRDLGCRALLKQHCNSILSVTRSDFPDWLVQTYSVVWPQPIDKNYGALKGSVFSYLIAAFNNSKHHFESLI